MGINIFLGNPDNKSMDNFLFRFGMVRNADGKASYNENLDLIFLKDQQYPIRIYGLIQRDFTDQNFLEKLWQQLGLADMTIDDIETIRPGEDPVVFEPIADESVELFSNNLFGNSNQTLLKAIPHGVPLTEQNAPYACYYYYLPFSGKDRPEGPYVAAHDMWPDPNDPYGRLKCKVCGRTQGQKAAPGSLPAGAPPTPFR